MAAAAAPTVTADVAFMRFEFKRPLHFFPIPHSAKLRYRNFCSASSRISCSAGTHILCCRANHDLKSLRKQTYCSPGRSICALGRVQERGVHGDDEAVRVHGDDGAVHVHQGLEDTQRLVECAMHSAITGLAYFLSNSLRLENYFSCFFPLPLVIASMKWGVAAGRKTMVSTTILLLVLCGPLKAASYLFMHGLVGLSMGITWRKKTNWLLSIIICSLVRAVGGIATILLSSWILKQNILQLITINAHAYFTSMFAAMGINLSLSMKFIYSVFTSLLLVNCASSVFLLHVLYAIFLKRLGIQSSILHPGWLKKAT